MPYTNSVDYLCMEYQFYIFAMPHSDQIDRWAYSLYNCGLVSHMFIFKIIRIKMYSINQLSSDSFAYLKN